MKVRPHDVANNHVLNRYQPATGEDKVPRREARRAARDEINAARVLGPVHRRHVPVERHVGPMVPQHRTGVRLNLGVTDARHPGALKAHAQGTGAGEQLDIAHHARLQA
jgi:hypothetical protein